MVTAEAIFPVSQTQGTGPETEAAAERFHQLQAQLADRWQSIDALTSAPANCSGSFSESGSG